MTAGRILLVEDALGISRALGRALSLSQGDEFSVESCDRAELAVEYLQERSFDLLITDLRLPGMSGLELLEWAQRSCPELRSILITAYGTPQLEEQARRLTDAYLPKPFRLNDLLRLVRVVL
ncbi:MAG: response regulator, partial [Chloroflexota bacterium]